MITTENINALHDWPVVKGIHVVTAGWPSQWASCEEVIRAVQLGCYFEVHDLSAYIYRYNCQHPAHRVNVIKNNWKSQPRTPIPLQRRFPLRKWDSTSCALLLWLMSNGYIIVTHRIMRNTTTFTSIFTCRNICRICSTANNMTSTTIDTINQ